MHLRMAIFWNLQYSFSSSFISYIDLYHQEELLELQDPDLASTIRKQQQRSLEFWENNWVRSKFFLKFVSLPLYINLQWINKLC